MVITRVKNRFPDMILTPFDWKFHEKKDELPLGIRRPPNKLKKNNVEKVITRVKNGSPDMILKAFDGKFQEKKDEIPPGAHRPPYASKFSILGVRGLT